MPVRIAHYSDIHVTMPPIGQLRDSLEPKRIVGSLNYYLGNRRGHFRGVEGRIEALLADVDEQSIDHAICTGDLTAMSFEAELERAAALFGDRLGRPERLTVLPGNHDRYTVRADRERRFEAFFGSVGSPGGGYPFRKSIAKGVSLVAIDVCRSTSLLDSSGQAGAEQLARARELLAEAKERGEFVIFALHYALLRKSGRRDRRSHGVRDDVEVMGLLEDPEVRVDLVIHGHVHEAYALADRRVPIVCAGSATDLHQRCGYNIYEIDVPSGLVSIERRAHEGGRYVRSEVRALKGGA
ncbi:MAG: metallophosphoesterase [Deltaproteobacteria bacterium]|nr:metallophosphoesterase [Deltaproteobacteria bacterium]